MKTFFKYYGAIAARTFLAVLILGSPTAYAGIINGQFTLVADGNTAVNSQEQVELGDVIATVSFTYDDTDFGVDPDPFRMFDAFNLSALVVTDVTNVLDLDNNPGALAGGVEGQFLLGGNFNFPTSATATPPLLAIFNPVGGAFVGVIGTIQESGPPVREFIFTANSLTINGATALNTGSLLQDSYHLVPEPTALALLGIGLVGFGAARTFSRRGLV